MSEDSSSPYQPLPVDGCSIRLLRILEVKPAANRTNANVCCELNTARLEHGNPEYAALSYVWGRPFEDSGGEYDDTVPILVKHGEGSVDKRQHLIGLNLHEALVQIYATQWQSWLWVDSLCIDQGNDEERSAQVQMMGKVYEKASRTFCWYGKSGPDADDISYLFNSFAPAVQDWYKRTSDHSKAKLCSMPTLTATDDEEFVFEGIDAPLSVRRLLAQRKFESRVRYFKRMWIIQELALSNCPVHLYGSHVLQPDGHILINSWLYRFPACDTVLRIRGNPSYARPEAQSLVSVMKSSIIIGFYRPQFVGIESCSGGDSNGSASETQQRSWALSMFGANTSEEIRASWLELILGVTLGFECTDRRDHFFGILGLMSLLEPPLPMKPSLVNYERSVASVFVDLSTYLLLNTRYMTSLALLPTYASRRLAEVPSWAIDPTASHPVFGWQFCGLQGKMHSSNGRKVGKASDAYPARDAANSEIEIDGSALRVFGNLCSRVENICDASLSFNHFKYDFSESTLYTLEETASLFAMLGRFAPTYRIAGGGSAFVAIASSYALKPHLVEQDGMVTAFWRDKMFAPYLCNPQLANLRSPQIEEKLQQCLAVIRDEYAKLSRYQAIPPDLSDLATDDMLTQLSSSTDHTAIAAIAPKTTDPSLSIQWKLTGHALFTTENGYIGSGKEGTQAGDELWLLCRARVPQILRPVPDGRYIIIGEAYVHGGMEGELLDRGVAGPLRRIEIV